MIGIVLPGVLDPTWPLVKSKTSKIVGQNMGSKNGIVVCGWTGLKGYSMWWAVFSLGSLEPL